MSTPPHTPILCSGEFRDGFSGWFAVSDSGVCNDFCFWDWDHILDVQATPKPVLNATKNDTQRSGWAGWNAFNTADPSVSTIAPDGSPWTCILSAGSDPSINWVNAVKTPPTHFPGNSFPFLRCNRGAREIIGPAKEETAFFWAWMLVALVLGGTTLGYGCIRARIRLNRRRQTHLYKCVPILHVKFLLKPTVTGASKPPSSATMLHFTAAVLSFLQSWHFSCWSPSSHSWRFPVQSTSPRVRAGSHRHAPPPSLRARRPNMTSALRPNIVP